MTKGETSSTFTLHDKMSDQEHRKFQVWIKNNASIASIFVIGLLAIVVVGAHRDGKTPIMVSSEQSIDLSGIERRNGRVLASINPNELTLSVLDLSASDASDTF